MSFDLHYISAQNSDHDPKLCFMVFDYRDPVNKRIDLCIRRDNLRRSESTEMARSGWIKDIMDFKNNCVPKSRFLHDQSFDYLKDDIRREAMMRAKERVQERSYESNERQIMGQLQQQNVMSQGAMVKEQRYEQLAINEEMQREDELQRRMQYEMEKEKMRQNCFTRDLDVKARQGSEYAMNQNLMFSMMDMRNRASNLIRQSRLRVKQRLMALRKVFEERRILQMQKMMEMKSTLSTQIVIANKMGDSSHCNPHLPIPAKLDYCQTNFQTRPDAYADCQKSSIDFCYTCCENEFGGMYEEKRESCFHQCIGNGDGLEAFMPLSGEGMATGAQDIGANKPLNGGESSQVESESEKEKDKKKEEEEDDEDKPEEEIDSNIDDKKNKKTMHQEVPPTQESKVNDSIMPSESGVMAGANNERSKKKSK